MEPLTSFPLSPVRRLRPRGLGETPSAPPSPTRRAIARGPPRRAPMNAGGGSRDSETTEDHPGNEILPPAPLYSPEQLSEDSLSKEAPRKKPRGKKPRWKGCGPKPGRPRMDDVPLPDLEGLVKEEAEEVMRKYRLRKNSEACKRTTQNAMAHHREMLLTGEHPVVFRRLAEIGPEDLERMMPAGTEFAAKHLVVHAIKTIAEAKGITPRWVKTDAARVFAVPSGASGHAVESMSIDVRFKAREDLWRVKSSQVSAQMGGDAPFGTEPGFRKRGSAFKDKDVAVIIMPRLREDPTTKLEVLREEIAPYLRHPQLLNMSRVRRIAREKLARMNDNPQ